MKRIFALLSLVSISATLVFTACKKTDDPVPPTITFKKEAGFVSANASAKYGDTLRFGITVANNGNDNLAKFQIFANNNSILDTTINTPNFVYNFYNVKGITDKDVWKFVSKDIAGNTKTDSIIITGNFGQINTFGAITIGAQSNATAKGFLSLGSPTATQYTQDEAFNHQADIDMFCFYENSSGHVNLMSLAAPGSNITGIFTGATTPGNYTTKNITFFVKTTLTAAQFDAVQNDAVILASFVPANQFKKAKLLAVGEVYAIKLQSGKYGLYKVTAVDGTETGTIQIAAKIQK